MRTERFGAVLNWDAKEDSAKLKEQGQEQGIDA